MKNLKLAVRETKQRTVINVSDVAVGRDLVVIAGPCSVESEKQMFASAHVVKDAGAFVPYIMGMQPQSLKFLRQIRQ